MLQSEKALIVISIMGLLWGGAFRMRGEHFPDDAFITYRYARNFAEGLGMVYNPGERILGTTAPFHAALLSVGMRMGISPVVFSRVIDLVFFGFMIFFILKIARNILGGLWWLWLWAALMMNVPWISLTGMETWAYSFLIYFSLWMVIKKHIWGMCLGAALCGIMRPDGFLVCIIVFPIILYRYLDSSAKKRKSFRYPILTGLLIILIGLLIPTLYYGSWFPESAIVKREMVALDLGWKSYFTGTFLKYYYSNGFPTPLMLAMLSGFVLGMVYHSKLAPFLIWGLLYQLFLILGRAPWYEWYETPALPWFFLCVAIFWRYLYDKMEAPFTANLRGFERFRRRGLVLLLSLFCLLPLFKKPQKIKSLIETSPETNLGKKGNREAGRWIAKNAAPGARVAAFEIGAVGYFSERRVHDLIGIVTPEPGMLYRRTSQWDITREKKCEYILYPFANLPGDFLCVPSKMFWRDYRIAGFWQNSEKGGVIEIPILFQRHSPKMGEKASLLGNISAPLRENETGVAILKMTPHTALKGVMDKCSPQSFSWTFVADSEKMNLEFTPSVLPPHVFEGACLIEERMDNGDWKEHYRLSIRGGDRVRVDIMAMSGRPVIRIRIFPYRIPRSQGFFLLDAEATYLK